MSTSAIFNGTSRFSSDFQQIITRSLAIASLPLNQLNATKTHLTNQSNELTSISGKFSALQTAIASLQTAIGPTSFNSSVSDGSIARVTLGSGANPGLYSIEVTSLGSYTNAVSSAGTTITDPSSTSIATDSSFNLNINGTLTTITPTGNNLNALVDALNSQSGGAVQASIVNLGSTASPDYRLAIQSTKLAGDSIQLTGSSGDLLDPIASGAPATYKLNGINTVISSSSRSITLAPGLTADLLGQSATGVATSITISRNTSSISNSLSSFVNSYNAAVDGLNNDRGQGTGSLNGQSIVYTLGQTLKNISNYTSSSGSFQSLSSLGVAFDSTGHLTFDSTVFSAATAANTPAVLSFLGDASTGGFLKAATDAIAGAVDPTTGSVAGASQGYADQISTEDSLITTSQDRINQLQTSLQSRLAAADALVAQLEQKYNYINGLFQALQSNSKA